MYKTQAIRLCIFPTFLKIKTMYFYRHPFMITNYKCENREMWKLYSQLNFYPFIVQKKRNKSQNCEIKPLRVWAQQATPVLGTRSKLELEAWELGHWLKLVPSAERRVSGPASKLDLGCDAAQSGCWWLDPLFSSFFSRFAGGRPRRRRVSDLKVFPHFPGEGWGWGVLA